MVFFRKSKRAKKQRRRERMSDEEADEYADLLDAQQESATRTVSGFPGVFDPSGMSGPPEMGEGASAEMKALAHDVSERLNRLEQGNSQSLYNIETLLRSMAFNRSSPTPFN